MKKIAKKIAVLLTIILAFPVITVSFTGCAEREEILKIYNSGEYISDGSDGLMDIVSEFETWYEEKTGKPIRVEYNVYDTNETMYTQINSKHVDYDLVCPSDYMVEKMLKKDLLLPINSGNWDEIWADSFSDEDPEDYGLEEDDDITIQAILNDSMAAKLPAFDPGWENYYADGTGKIYSVPYIMGSFGILYDYDKITEIGGEDAEEDMYDWEAIFGSKYSGHIYMKSSIRDAYAVTNIYANQQELLNLSLNGTDYDNLEYRRLLEDCFNNPTEAAVAKAEEILKEQKQYLFAYESDEGKEDLLVGKSEAALSFVWSCDAGYVIGMEENLALRYSVPEAGTNLWIDNWCIPKYSQNPDAARYFISFCNTYDVAYDNMWYIGSSVPVRAVSEQINYEIIDPWSAAADEGDDVEDYLCFAELYEECKDECTQQEDCDCDWHNYARMYSECIYPSDDTIARAAVMTDFGDWNTAITRMFVRVKAY